MANLHQLTGASADQEAHVAMATTLTAWGSLLTGVNTQLFGEFGAVAAEWQHFVNRRLKEDIGLLRRVTRSSGPDQVLAAYTDFWCQAVEDYGNELATMTKLFTDATSKIAAATKSGTEEATTRLVQRKAA